MAKKYNKVGGRQNVGISTTTTAEMRRRWDALAKKKQRPHTKMVADAMEEFLQKYEP